MDGIDFAILQELKANGRASASEISKRVNLSIPAVAERIRKLEQADVIGGYTIKINREKIGQKLLAFLFVSLDGTKYLEHFRSTVVGFDCVLECHHIAGTYDYLLKVVVEDTLSLERFLSQSLKKIKGVARSNTIIALTTLKEELNP